MKRGVQLSSHSDPIASSQRTRTMNKHLVSNRRALPWGGAGGDRFLVDAGPISIVIFYLQKINIVVRMSAQHPSGQKSSGF